MTLDELRTGIQALGYGLDTVDAQTAAINTAYRDIAGERRWWWLESTAEISMASGGSEIVLADVSDFRALIALRLRPVAGAYPLLQWLEPQQFRDVSTSDPDAQGAPQFWTRRNQSLVLWPMLDVSYTAELDYVRDAPALVADADEPMFPAVYHDLLVWGPVQQVAFRERDWSAYASASAQYERLLARMRNEDVSVRQQQSSTEVVATGWYGG